MSYLLASAARATIGARSGQEDAFRVWPGEGVVQPTGQAGLLAVLADGMGGHRGGAIAGQTACETFTDAFAAAEMPYDKRFVMALNASNDALADGVERNASLKGMGCTLIGAWFDDAGIRWTSVGDSLLLLYRFPDVIRLNEDHSLGSYLDEQARRNEISVEEARGNRHRNALRSALTGGQIDLVDLRAEPLQIMAGDWIVLASDGLASLEGDELADVMYRYREGTPEEMASGLIAAVEAKGVPEQDNTTVVAIRVEGASETVMVRPQANGEAEDATLRTRRIGVVSGRKMVRTAVTKPIGKGQRPPPPRSTLETLLTRGPVALLLAAAAAFVLAAAVFLFKASRTASPEPVIERRGPGKVERVDPDPGRQTQQSEPVERGPSRIIEPADPQPPPPAPQTPPPSKAVPAPVPAAPKAGPGPSTGPDPGPSAPPATRSGPPRAPKSQTQTQTPGDPGAADPDSLRDTGEPQPQEGGAPRLPRKSERTAPPPKDAAGPRREKKEATRVPP
ncbi:MAG: protein phosphatase 2C domain-containing protein [Hyphomicrobiaceae bacterium]|nr:protein phosphatase 2C domain-containing protein [Hyphomicrobiaceae bacterium]